MTAIFRSPGKQSLYCYDTRQGKGRVNKTTCVSGLLECYHITRQSLGLDSCVIVAAKLIGPVGEETTQIPPEKVYSALAYAIQQHVALSAEVDETTSVFKRLSVINMEKSVHFLTKEEQGNSITTLFEREFTNPIGPNSNDGLLWRLTITLDNTVIFSWHHCIGDGQSGLAFLRTFLEGLNKGGHEYITVVQTPDKQLAPAIDDLTDLSPSFLTILGAVLGLFLPKATKDIWTGNVVSTKKVFRTRVRMVTISDTDFIKLRTLAKEHKTTFTAILHTLCVCSLSKVVLSNPSNTVFRRFTTSVPISLRPLANISPTTMGDFGSSLTSTHKLKTDFSWEDATLFKQQLHKSIPKSRQLVGLLKLIRGQYVKYLGSKQGKKREASFAISNLGLYISDSKSNFMPSTKDKEWTFGDMYFSQDDGTLGAALKANVVGSPNGNVNITISWGEAALSDDDAKAFVAELERSIRDLVGA